MNDVYVRRSKHSFPQWIYGNIRACLNSNQGVGATILICCAIDTLSFYASANPNTVGNKNRFTEFVSKYFPPSYNPESFYKFIRCGLVHTFNMENQYLIVCSNEKWAHLLHFKQWDNSKRIIINPFVLMKHLKIAHTNFINTLNDDINMREKFLEAYKLRPLKKQIKSVKMFERQFKSK